MNNPSLIPEEVLKGMEIDSERKYPFRSFGSSKNNNEQRYRRESYISGRQDEWERQREEIGNLRNEMKRIFYVYNSGNPDIDQKWIDYKRSHNIK